MENKIFDFIVEYACREGVLPTYREICDGVGLASVSSVFCYFLKLEDEGKIERVGRNRFKVRGLRYVSDMG